MKNNLILIAFLTGAVSLTALAKVEEQTIQQLGGCQNSISLAKSILDQMAQSAAPGAPVVYQDPVLSNNGYAVEVIGSYASATDGPRIIYISVNDANRCQIYSISPKYHFEESALGEKTVQELGGCQDKIDLAKSFLSQILQTNGPDVQLTFPNVKIIKGGYGLKVMGLFLQSNGYSMEYAVRIDVNSANQCQISSIEPTF